MGKRDTTLGIQPRQSIKTSAKLSLRCKFQFPKSLKDEWICLFILNSFIHSLIFPQWFSVCSQSITLS